MMTVTKHIDIFTLRNLLVVAMGLALFGLTSSCNTMAGVGQDVEQTGEAIEDAAY